VAIGFHQVRTIHCHKQGRIEANWTNC